MLSKQEKQQQSASVVDRFASEQRKESWQQLTVKDVSGSCNKGDMLRKDIKNMESLKDFLKILAVAGTDVEKWTKYIASLEHIIEWSKELWKLPDVTPIDDEAEYLLCISGKIGNVCYEHAIITNCDWEDGQWYYQGIKLKSVEIHAWMEIPFREEMIDL